MRHTFVLLRLGILLSLLLASDALAVSTVAKEFIGNGSGGRVAMSATTSSSPWCTDITGIDDIVFWLDADAVSGTTPTLDCKVQYSPDRKNWKDMPVPFTQVTTSDDLQTLHLNNQTFHMLKCTRIVCTLTGTSPVYNVLVMMYYRRTS